MIEWWWMWHLFKHFCSWSEIFMFLFLLFFINLNSSIFLFFHLLFFFNFLFIIIFILLIFHGFVRLLFIHDDLFVLNFSVLLFWFLFSFLFLHFAHCQHIHDSFLFIFFILVKLVDIDKFVSFLWCLESFKMLEVLPKFYQSFISFEFSFKLFEFEEDLL